MRLDLPRRLATRSTDAELIDVGSHDLDTLSENLREIRRINRWLGGCWLTLRALERLVDGLPPVQDLRVLDVGTGSADIPEAIGAWARRQGRSTRVVATDLSEEVLRVARIQVTGRDDRFAARDRPARPGDCRDSGPRRPVAAPSIELLVADGRSLPFPDQSFDVAICSLVLHHLDPDAAVRLLAELRRVSRRGLVVNDLVRSWPAYLGACLVCRLFSRNPLTRHDGPLSVRRAYTARELSHFLGQAQLREVELSGSLGYRIALIGWTAPSLRLVL